MMENLKLIRRLLENEAIKIIAPNPKRVFILVPKEKLKDAIRKLIKSKGYSHILTLTGVDIGDEIEIIYHMIHKGLTLSLRTRVSKENPVLPTIVDLVPGSVLYEREVHDLLGVEFKGNSDLSRLLLSDDWPPGVYPLRKENVEDSEEL